MSVKADITIKQFPRDLLSEAVEAAATQLVIDIGFLVPRGTDVYRELGKSLKAYKEAIENRAAYDAKLGRR